MTGRGIDVIEFARDLGIVVYRTDLEPNLRASLFRSGTDRAQLHLNVADTPERQQEVCGWCISLFWRFQHRQDFGWLVGDDEIDNPKADPESERGRRFLEALRAQAGRTAT